MIMCCEQHIELAIDDYVEEFELSPDVEAVQSGAGICRYCTAPATYQVGEDATERNEQL